MNGPTLIEAFRDLAMLGDHEEILEPRATWLVTSSGKAHAETHTGLEGETLTPHEGTLKQYLDSLSCNRRVCKAVLTIFGPDLAENGAIAQAYAEARASLLKFTAKKGAITRFETDQVEAPLRRLLTTFGPDHSLLSRYVERISLEAEQGRRDHATALRSPESRRRHIDETIEELLFSKHRVLSRVHALMRVYSKIETPAIGMGRSTGSAYNAHALGETYSQASYVVDDLGVLARLRADIDNLMPASIEQIASTTLEQVNELAKKYIGAPLMLLMFKAWRAEVMREVNAAEQRVDELSVQMRADTRRFAVYLHGIDNFEHRYRENRQLGPAFGWSPDAKIAVLPGIIVDRLDMLPTVRNEEGSTSPLSQSYAEQFVQIRDGSVFDDPLPVELLEIAETLLSDDPGLTLVEAWSMAAKLAN